MNLYPGFKAGKLQIAADDRTKSLLVFVPKAMRREIRELVSFLDKPETAKRPDDALPGDAKKNNAPGLSGSQSGGFKRIPGTGKSKITADDTSNDPKPGPPTSAAAPETEEAKTDGEPRATTRLDDDELKIKIFRLRHADATASRNLFIGVFPEKVLNRTTINADVRTNSLVIRGPEDVLEVLEAILVTLDGFEGDASHPFAGTSGGDNKKGTARERPKTPESLARETWLKELQSTDQPEAEVAHVAQEFRRQNQLSADLAQQFRKMQNVMHPDNPRLQKVKAQLDSAVKAAFDARQKFQSYEVEKLRRRLAQVEQRIAIREPLQKQIIERRIEELLQPEKKWEPGEDAAVTPTAIETPTPTRSGKTAAERVRNLDRCGLKPGGSLDGR